MSSQNITEIVLAIIAVFAAAAYIFISITKNKNSNNINQSANSVYGDINQAGRDNNVEKK